ncbi:MAG: hypothetical protein ABIU96_02035 [Rhodanobacter sp.]
MRQLYTSPRSENIDRLVTLLAENGIATSVHNRSRYDHPKWKRASYLQRRERRDDWAQVWVTHPDDYTRARVILTGLGIEPFTVHGAELAAARSTSPDARRQNVAARARRIVLLVVLAACVVLMLRYLHYI